MAGLLLHSAISGRLSGATYADSPPNMGADSVVSPSPMVSVSTAAFGPTASTPAASKASFLHPRNPTAATLYLGIGAIAVLWIIRQSLPA